MMDDRANITHLYGIIGYPLTHSFSRAYFTEKFEKEGLQHCRYDLFRLDTIEQFPEILRDNPNLVGLNVTIPYKQAVLPFLDGFGEGVESISAVNVIKISGEKLIGYNSDVDGFETSLRHFLNGAKPEAALVLGSGGASKAVQFVLTKMKIPFQVISRSGQSYDTLTQQVMQAHPLIINATPLGMAPALDTCPDIPYEYLDERHWLFDLVYNREPTLFLQKGSRQGARTRDGLEMLYAQADKAWAIWNEK